MADAVDIEPADRKRFQELADRWQEETFFLSRSDRVIAHPAHQEIISMGEPVVPLILERMRSQGGHWFEALQQITGADPVSPVDYGKIAAMQNSWLQWGEHRGYSWMGMHPGNLDSATIGPYPAISTIGGGSWTDGL
ncbi:MAG: hypothetical protein OXU28_03780 [Chloroflexota bacterium]|nr:hypothetical protein [Chloroflexota bacterium]